ncbi:TetR/AcrR family transcriptional regulator [Oceanobacillus sp. J11TS1]|uniref:TetR/AcrR family transcriptional regulator n=1 Tax=Oceanobacillus sp. J11TS1 TaxID=2807191 RepID=UPI001B23BDA2|nr:TetR/AcrR family transcriptional regulator [Oceanobacillus sp. J11TS1]GIO23776.1 TetR family transcriptional regulator [Oceanobacillus sp. J11TS1]
MKERILKAALTLFAQKGYHATSVQEIANCAEVSRSTLYAYFTSKRNILISVYQFYLDSLYDHLQMELKEHEQFAERLKIFKKVLRSYLSVPFEHEEFLIMQMNEQNINDPEVANYVIEKRNQIYKRLVEIMQFLGGKDLNFCSLDIVIILNSLVEEYSVVAIYDRKNIKVDDLVEYISQIITCVYEGFTKNQIEPLLDPNTFPEDYEKENNIDIRSSLNNKIEDLELLIKNIRLSREEYLEVSASIKLIRKELIKPQGDLIIVQGLLRNIGQIKDLRYIVNTCISTIQQNIN